MSEALSNEARLNAIAPKRIRAQAAAWVTDLHGPKRDAALESRVRRWIAADSRHAAAFELATDAWQRSGQPLGAPLPRIEREPVQRPSRVPLWATAAAVSAVLLVTLYFATDPSLRTGPGEQRTVDLSDGTEVTLSANTRLAIHYDKDTRFVALEQGEALFQVMHQEPRPFVVGIDAHKVIAIGTVFDVRREDGAAAAFTVTLVDGRVAVERQEAPNILPAISGSGVTVLAAGERLHRVEGSVDRLDRPSLERVTAWQKGELIFDDVSLREAVREFNRYGAAQINLADSVAAQYRVGGVFRIGDPGSFALAMTNSYPLRMSRRGRDIVLEPK
jgi:transmembrane sensor